MFTFNTPITKACLLAGVLSVTTACKDTDDFFSNDGQQPEKQEVYNTFNFATTHDVDLIIDYSAYQTHGPVRFSIYSSDPYLGGNEVNPYMLDESIDPIFTDFTDAQGHYDKTVTLPAYARVLYITTGDLYVAQKRLLAEVTDGVARAVATNDGAKAGAARTTTRALGTGVQTRDLSNLYNLSYIINPTTGAKTDEQIYKEWLTPLGTWDSNSGRPSYLLEHTAANKAKGLVLDDDVMEGLFTEIKKVLRSNQECPKNYRDQADMTLQHDSEVSITMLGGNTCWCSSLGYYYYTDANIPTSPMDLNIIMLFPNTMDEIYEDKPSCDMNGNTGVYTGDVVQLMYYPNIDKGDLSGATPMFPAGTKIGFIMKSNGWGSQPGSGYCLVKGVGGIGWDCSRKYNVWPTSTNGVSFCRPNGSGSDFAKLNPNGDSRTAKIGFKANDGRDYAIVSFEDACNDLNHSDVIFALNPAEAFTALPEVEAGKTSTYGVYAFEDRWPSRGDYDMNDVVVNEKNELILNSSNKVTKQVLYLTTYQKNVELINGLAVRLQTKPSKVAMKRMAPGVTDVTKAVTANFEKYTDTNTGFDVYYLTNRVEDDLGSTYILELTYNTPIDIVKAFDGEPFIYRPEDNSSKQLEIHIPMSKPTMKVETKYFGTEDDRSVPASGVYYVRGGAYPFAFYLSGTKAEKFFDTILGSSAANQPIDMFYPNFLIWSASKGAQYPDWYLR